MVPESVEGRIGRLEQKAAALEQRVTDLGSQVTALSQLPREMERVIGQIQSVRDDVRDLGDGVRSIRASLESRDKQTTDERRSLRIALITLTGVIIAALIAAVATIVSAGL